MRRRVTIPIVSVAAILGSFLVATEAQAHGYISSPPSRQANCAQGKVANCGDIVYEPQSVEAPKGSTQCNGGGSRFAVLNDNSRPGRSPASAPRSPSTGCSPRGTRRPPGNTS